MVSSDALVGIIKMKDLPGYILHNILMFLFDVFLHRLAEDVAVF